MFMLLVTGAAGATGSPGSVSEENLLDILKRPETSDIQSDDTNAYDELNNIKQIVDGVYT